MREKWIDKKFNGKSGELAVFSKRKKWIDKNCIIAIFLLLFFDVTITLLFGHRIPEECTDEFYLQEILEIVADEYQKTGTLPQDLEPAKIKQEHLRTRYYGDHVLGLIKWYIHEDKLIVEWKSPNKSLCRMLTIRDK